MLAAAIVAVISGAAAKNYKAIRLGAASLMRTAIVWIGGAPSSAATEDPDTLGGVAPKA
jgi:hypothetical protein